VAGRAGFLIRRDGRTAVHQDERLGAADAYRARFVPGGKSVRAGLAARPLVVVLRDLMCIRLRLGAGFHGLAKRERRAKQEFQPSLFAIGL
jgi:hypothetical protein